MAMSPLYFKLLMELLTYKIKPAPLKGHNSAVMRALPASPAAYGAQCSLGIDPHLHGATYGSLTTPPHSVPCGIFPIETPHCTSIAYYMPDTRSLL